MNSSVISLERGLLKYIERNGRLPSIIQFNTEDLSNLLKDSKDLKLTIPPFKYKGILVKINSNLEKGCKTFLD